MSFSYLGKYLFVARSLSFLYLLTHLHTQNTQTHTHTLTTPPHLSPSQPSLCFHGMIVRKKILSLLSSERRHGRRRVIKITTSPTITSTSVGNNCSSYFRSSLNDVTKIYRFVYLLSCPAWITYCHRNFGLF